MYGIYLLLLLLAPNKSIKHSDYPVKPQHKKWLDFIIENAPMAYFYV